MDLRACPRCASLDLHGQTLGEGLAVGMEGMAAVCAECGFQGAPLLFAREADYVAFREAQRGPPGAERGAKEAAAEAEREAEESAEEAAREPLPAEFAHPTAPGFPYVPATVFLIGAGSLVLGLLSLRGSRSPSLVSANEGIVGLPLALIGLGFMLVAWRLARQRRSA